MSTKSSPTWLADPEIPPPARVGTVLDAIYRLDAFLGQGSTGITYHAWHLHQHASIAVKLLHRPGMADLERVQRLLADLRTLAGLQGLGFQSADLAFTSDGAPILASELLIGETLRQRLQRGSLPAPMAGALLAAVARALKEAHQAGVVHGNLRPENIFLVSAPGRHFSVGQVVLLDAALHWLWPSGKAPEVARQYLAPEQASGAVAEADAAGDVFAVGAILYECLSGQPAFQGDSPDVILKKLQAPPPPLTLPPEFPAPPELVATLDIIISGACAERPAARVASMDRLLLAMKLCFAGAGLPLAEGPAPQARSGRSPSGERVVRELHMALERVEAERIEAERAGAERADQARQRKTLAATARRRAEEAERACIEAEGQERKRAKEVQKLSERVAEIRRSIEGAAEADRAVLLAEVELAEAAQRRAQAQLGESAAELQEISARADLRRQAVECAQMEAADAEALRGQEMERIERATRQLLALRERATAAAGDADTGPAQPSLGRPVEVPPVADPPAAQPSSTESQPVGPSEAKVSAPKASAAMPAVPGPKASAAIPAVPPPLAEPKDILPPPPVAAQWGEAALETPAADAGWKHTLMVIAATALMASTIGALVVLLVQQGAPRPMAGELPPQTQIAPPLPVAQAPAPTPVAVPPPAQAAPAESEPAAPAIDAAPPADASEPAPAPRAPDPAAERRLTRRGDPRIPPIRTGLEQPIAMARPAERPAPPQQAKDPAASEEELRDPFNM